MQSTESLLVLCFNSSLLKYGGDLAVGAMTILSSVMQFSMLPLQGLTQGAQPIISFNYGAGNIDRVKKAFHLLLVSCLVYSSVMWVLCMLFPQMFAAIFTGDPALTQITVWALRIYIAAVFLMGAQLACQQTFIALGNAKISTFLALLRKIILLIPLIYILPNFFENKVICSIRRGTDCRYNFRTGHNHVVLPLLPRGGARTDSRLSRSRENKSVKESDALRVVFILILNKDLRK